MLRRDRSRTWPSSSTSRPAIGRRCWSQRPAAGLLSTTRAVTGACRPLESMAAWPEMRVRGSALLSVARSRSLAAALSAASGQAAKGSTLASARSVAPGAWSLPRRVCNASLSNGPRAPKLARHAGTASSCERASAFNSTAKGASALMRPLASIMARSKCRRRSSMRCSAPAFAPSITLPLSWLIGATPSSCSVPMRACRNVRARGRRRLSGRTRGWSEPDPSSVARSTVGVSRTTPIQAPSCGRQDHCASCQATPCSTSVRAPQRHSMRSAVNGPPCQRPLTPLALRPGNCCRAQVLAASLRCSHAKLATPTATTRASPSAIGMAIERNPRRAGEGGWGGWGADMLRRRCPPTGAGASA